MAITLDELLGRNTQSVARSSVDSFPSYEEFNASRTQGYSAPQPVQNAVRYNFDTMPAREVRSAESVRAYEANRPYIAPQNSEYQTRDYAFYDSLTQPAPAREQYQPTYTEAPAQGYDRAQAQPMQYAQPVQYAQPQSQSFYEFTAQDSERLSGDELYSKLAYTHQSNAPVFDNAQSTAPQRTSLFARRAQRVQDTSETKQRGRLNTKGKIILGVYIAVIALVASLIIVNATRINQGKAVTPTSVIELVQEQR